MRELSNVPSTAKGPDGLRGAVRLRTVLSLLIAAALAASVLAVTTPSASSAPRSGDTIALVDTQGRFTVLSELSSNAKTLSYTFGQPGDSPIMGDWDCDGEETPGVYRVSTGQVYLRNAHAAGNADEVILFGNPGDRPVAGDFNGDDCDTVSVYRPSIGRAYVKNSIRGGLADLTFAFGNPGDLPFAGDFNGNGVETLGLRRDSSGQVFLARSNGPTTATAISYGNPGDQIIAGDWDGDGVDTIASYRSSTGMFYYRNSNTTGTADGFVYVGKRLTVLPVSGVNTGAIDGERLDPIVAAPKEDVVAPPPSAPAPPAAAASPAPTSGPVSVPGFEAPVSRPARGPVVISGQSNVVIENVHISNPGGVCVEVTNASNVTIRNATIGPCGDEAVYLSDVDGAVIENNYITDVGTGVLVHRSDSVRVDENVFLDAGRNFVQFDKVDGPGSSISGNRGQNEIGATNAEDFISVYMSYGTAASPIRIVGNHLRSGGPSDSGSGIMLGDAGGSHMLVSENVLINPGQVGIGVASGENIRVLNNIIYSAAVPWSNTAMYVWNQYDSACGNIEVAGNLVNWTAAGGYSNPWWSGGGCSNLTVEGNDWEAAVGPGDF